MPRPPRLQVAGALYHVIARASVGRVAFQGDRERAQFLDVFAATVARYGWSCRAYCVLTTHYHLLLVPPQPDLAAGMQYLNGRYAQWANWSRGERGHIFEGRYRSVLVESGSHALELQRYIALNPVRAGLVRDPEAWRWSSLRFLMGRERSPAFVDVAAALADFGHTARVARRRLRTFIRDGIAQDVP